MNEPCEVVDLDDFRRRKSERLQKQEQVKSLIEDSLKIAEAWPPKVGKADEQTKDICQSLHEQYGVGDQLDIDVDDALRDMGLLDDLQKE